MTDTAHSFGSSKPSSAKSWFTSLTKQNPQSDKSPHQSSPPCHHIGRVRCRFCLAQSYRLRLLSKMACLVLGIFGTPQCFGTVITHKTSSVHDFTKIRRDVHNGHFRPAVWQQWLDVPWSECPSSRL